MRSVIFVHGYARVLGLAATIVSAGCNLTTDFEESEPPVIRVVNASTAGSVTIHLDGLATQMATIGSNAATPGCLLLAPGAHVLSFLEGGTLRDEFLASYARDRRYTVVLANVGTTFRSFVVGNDQEVQPGSNGLTLINATTAPGDIYVTAISEDPTPATKVASAVAPAATTADAPPFVMTPSANLRVRLFDVGTTTNPRSDITLVPLLDDRIGIVVFTDRIVGTDPGALQVDPCPR